MGKLTNLNPPATIADSDIPGSIARDAEVTAAIAAHVAAPSPHGGQNFTSTTKAVGFSTGFIQNSNPVNTCGFEIQAASSADAAFMSFHRPGVAGFHLGMSVGDNKLKIGGWSFGTVAYSVWTGSDGTPVWQNPSDRRLKKSIRPIPSSALELILQSQPVSFEYNSLLRKEYFGDEFQRKKVHYGFLANDFPLQDLVTEKDNRYLGLDYMEIIPFLCRAIQEQQAQINDLKRLVTDLN